MKQHPLPSTMTPLWIAERSLSKGMVNNRSGDTMGMAGPPAFPEDTAILVNLARDLNLYYKPFMLSFGLSLHVVCCLGFTRTKLYKKFFTQIFLAISIADIGFLITVMLLWLSEQSVDIYKVPGMCPMVIYMSHFFPFLSFWLSESAAAVIILQPNVGCVNKFSRGAGKGRILVLCIFVLSFTVYLYKTWTNGVITTGGRTYCTPLQPNQEAWKVLNILDVLFLLLIPLIGFVLFDAIVIFRHIHFYWQCQRQVGPRLKIAKDAMRIIIAHSFCFAFLVGPGCFTKILFYAKGGHWNPRINFRHLMLLNLFELLFLTYFAVTPFIHILVSSSFRTHVRMALQRVKHSTINNNVFRSELASEQTLL